MNANKWGEVRTNYQEKKNKINHINCNLAQHQKNHHISNDVYD
jgi:hypothetical protein